MSRVFISYIEEDGALARQIAEGLEAAGYRPWYYQRDSLPGVPYLDQVHEAITHSRAFVLILSTGTLKSPQVDIEIAHGLAQGVFFIPLLNRITYTDFRKKKARWALALGAAAASVIPPEGVSALIPSILRSLKQARILGAQTMITQAPRLLVHLDGKPDSSYLIRDGITVGRDPDNAVVLLHETVSRKHAHIKLGTMGIAVTDLSSSNGTYLHGALLEPGKPRFWKPGETLEIGPFRLSLLSAEPVLA